MSTKPDLQTQIASFTKAYQKVESLKAQTEAAEEEAGKIGDEIIKAHNKGPHTFAVPDGAGGFKALVVVFQRVAKTVRFHTTDVTALMSKFSHGDVAPPADPTASAPPADPTDPMAAIRSATA